MRWLLLLALISSCLGQDAFKYDDPAFLGSLTAPAGQSYLVKQSFETPTTGYDNGESWYADGTAAVNPAYSGLTMWGSQCLRIEVAAKTARAYISNIVGVAYGGTNYGFCQINVQNLPPAAGTYVFIGLKNGGLAGTTVCYITVDENGRFVINHSGSGTSTNGLDMISVNTTYNLWWAYAAASGAGNDGYAMLGFSTDGTRPTSGSKFKTKTNGTGQLTPDTLFLGNLSSYTYTNNLDRVLWSSFLLGDTNTFQ